MKNNLTDIQLRVVCDIVDAGKEAVLEEHKDGRLLWRFRHISSYDSIWVNSWYATTIRALIRKRVLVPEISNKEFSVQCALGLLNTRRYRLANRQKWEDILKERAVF